MTRKGLPDAHLEILRQRQAAIGDLVPPVALREARDPWWRDARASGEFLGRLFDSFFDRLGTPNVKRKAGYHQLARLVPAELIDPEVAGRPAPTPGIIAVSGLHQTAGLPAPGGR